MISICLPVYNFDVNELTEDLLQQAREYNIDIEILVFDDASLSYYKKRNSGMASKSHIQYLEFDQNLGRSKIRNRLADFAKGNWLLFLDCDMVPDSP
ncbi:MAG: glycosyltransferase family 2 protein, partial [Bacteroidetes bacterium HGW-Bacteroidetes-15]